MLSKAAYTWIARISAFVWGFAFIHLFKYILDNIYPFWSATTSLSFFAFLMIFIVWLSYTLFFNFHPYRNKLPRILYHIIFLVNAVIFYIALASIGEKTYLNLYPLLFTLQFFIFYFLIASIFPALLPFRISVLAGILPGLITYQYIGNIYIDIFLPAVIYLMPLSIFTAVKPSYAKSQQRMLPLRQTIDLLRYTFLGLAFYGIFDIYRGRFYITAFILAVGPVMSNFFLLTDKKKHHIKYGILLLGVSFILSAGLYSQIAMTYWAAISFSILTVWEGIYFKKTVEGDLKREQILSGFAFIIIILFYAISPEWIVILSGAIVFLIQLRILVYIAKGYRKTMSILFALSLFAWAIVIFSSYSSSYKRDFLAIHKIKNTNPPPTLRVLNLLKDKDTLLATNLFPESVVKKFSVQYGVQILPVEVNSPGFLSMVNDLYINHPKVVQIYTLKNLKPYEATSGQAYFFKYVTLHKIQNIYLYDYNMPSQYHNETETFTLSETPNINLMNIESWYSFAKDLSDWYLENKYDEYSLRVIKEMATWYDMPVIYRQIAHIYGILGDTQNQIEYRQKIAEKGAATIEDKNLLLELYFLSGDISKSSQLCDELMNQDTENLIVYQEWKYKIIKLQPNRYQLEALANTLRFPVDSLPPEKISRRTNLLHRIQDDLKSNPQWEEIYKKEKSRQENIVYPE